MCRAYYETSPMRIFLQKAIGKTINEVMTSIHTYVHTYIHTYIHTCVRTYRGYGWRRLRLYSENKTYIHTYIRTYIHTYRGYVNIHTYIHTYRGYVNIHTYIHTYVRTEAMGGGVSDYTARMSYFDDMDILNGQSRSSSRNEVCMYVCMYSWSYLFM